LVSVIFIDGFSLVCGDPIGYFGGDCGGGVDAGGDGVRTVFIAGGSSQVGTGEDVFNLSDALSFVVGIFGLFEFGVGTV
jgi:hypothetical protein